ncbi:hypothetical protein [uncultured Methylobacterium sp.]|uniref:hypothetical protein n=1 Tax=uncultured Methylobacterium sp. TaxID=157278 RepID=UPI00261CC456|nr:hypothetical protein [uncultured Methylobacterium sp.]
MAETTLVTIGSDARLVVLARTLHAPGPATAWEARFADRAAFGETCVGRALYRHRSVFRTASDAPVWSHLELTYFRDLVPADALRVLVFDRPPGEPDLLRAEILATTPASFVLPRGWQGVAGRPDRQASLEYLDVRPAHLGAYREIMRRFIGPAAARLVASGRFGTFRAMETLAVLVSDPALTTGWNQIHLCEVEAEGFGGFGRELDAALREVAPDGGFAGVFAGLGPMRTIPRWTFNDAVVEADAALGRPDLSDPC